MKKGTVVCETRKYPERWTEILNTRKVAKYAKSLEQLQNCHGSKMRERPGERPGSESTNSMSHVDSKTRTDFTPVAVLNPEKGSR